METRAGVGVEELLHLSGDKADAGFLIVCYGYVWFFIFWHLIFYVKSRYKSSLTFIRYYPRCCLIFVVQGRLREYRTSKSVENRKTILCSNTFTYCLVGEVINKIWQNCELIAYFSQLIVFYRPPREGGIVIVPIFTFRSFKRYSRIETMSKIWI